MIKSPLIMGGALISGVLALWFIPGAVDSYLVFWVMIVMLVASIIYGWAQKQWLLATLIGTYIFVTDLFGLVHAAPGLIWLAIFILWVGGAWLVGHVGNQSSRIFHQGLTSFLVVEVFLVLQFWPINIISKSVIDVSFTFFLWHEIVRSVPGRQRFQESVVPFFLIILLMTLTGRWMTF